MRIGRQPKMRLRPSRKHEDEPAYLRLHDIRESPRRYFRRAADVGRILSSVLGVLLEGLPAERSLP